MPARKLSDFELISPLGSGTVGTIYRAIDNSTGRQVALKLLSEHASKDQLIRRRFDREVHILQKLRHPNIVQYLDQGRDGDRLFYCMEVVEGTTLSDVLTHRERLDWKTVVECGWQISSALQHLHNHNIVHRDLKPSNLYLSTDGQVKLGDFGIALDTTAGDISEQGMTVGSWLYMSPEQIRGENSVGDQTDLYALGCLLYQMLTGTAPYNGESFAAIFEQHLNSPVPSVRDSAHDCPVELEALVSKLLQKSPANRPSSARETQGVLGSILHQYGYEQELQELQHHSVRSISRLAGKPLQDERHVSWPVVVVTLVLCIAFVAIAVIFGE